MQSSTSIYVYIGNRIIITLLIVFEFLLKVILALDKEAIPFISKI